MGGYSLNPLVHKFPVITKLVQGLNQVQMEGGHSDKPHLVVTLELTYQGISDCHLLHGGQRGYIQPPFSRNWSRGSISSKGGGLDTWVGGLNPGGSDAIYHWISSGPATPTVTAGFGVSSRKSGRHVMVSQASFGVESLPKSVASSAGIRDMPCSLSVASSSEASRMSWPLRHMRGSIHLWRSLTTLHRTLRGAPYLSTLHCKALANTKVSSFWVSLKSLVPWKSWCSTKSCWSKLWMLIRASHQPATSSWTVGSLKAVACFLAAHCTRSSVNPSENSS